MRREAYIQTDSSAQSTCMKAGFHRELCRSHRTLCWLMEGLAPHHAQAALLFSVQESLPVGLICEVGGQSQLLVVAPLPW